MKKKKIQTRFSTSSKKLLKNQYKVFAVLQDGCGKVKTVIKSRNKNLETLFFSEIKKKDFAANILIKLMWVSMFAFERDCGWNV